MDEKASGIILRTRLLTETSLIVQWLTPDLGRISTVAKGARRSKSPFLGKLDLYYDAEFTFARARKSSLHTLREVGLKATRPFLRTEIVALGQAAKAGRRIERATEEETPLPEVFELFHAFLDALEKPPIEATTLIGFEIRLLEILGFRPELKGSSLNAGAARALERIASLDWAALRRLKLTPSQIFDIEAFLERSFHDAMR